MCYIFWAILYAYIYICILCFVQHRFLIIQNSSTTVRYVLYVFSFHVAYSVGCIFFLCVLHGIYCGLA